MSEEFGDSGSGLPPPSSTSQPPSPPDVAGGGKRSELATTLGVALPCSIALVLGAVLLVWLYRRYRRRTRIARIWQQHIADCTRSINIDEADTTRTPFLANS
uniref:Uncharacterized protein n=1 Tax=Coccolithus braarudii TaxID=221442 RepID=A0A7S0LIZ4_9EUKA